MLTASQYRVLSTIRDRTDLIIDGELDTSSFYHFSSLDTWKFFKKNNFIKGGVSVFSSITFVGRVALAAYENNNISG